jgi:hypothetical protein
LLKELRLLAEDWQKRFVLLPSLPTERTAFLRLFLDCLFRFELFHI